MKLENILWALLLFFVVYVAFGLVIWAMITSPIGWIVVGVTAYLYYKMSQ